MSELHSPTDEALYQRIKRSGDLAAFDVLYERHKLGLSRFIERFLSDDGDVEDVFHETFVQVMRSDEIDFSRGTFRGWTFVVARNLCRNRERTTRRSRRALARMETDLHQPSAEILLGEASERARLRTAAGSLPGPLADVFRLKMAGSDQSEIADALGVPVGTVKSRFHAILRFLKSEMTE